MRYIKCINPLAINLTYGKIYEVISLYTSDWSNVTYVRILNNNGVEVTYDISPSIGDISKKWFEDATAEVRDNKLNQLLDEEKLKQLEI
jgi:hypothetical protein